MITIDEFLVMLSRRNLPQHPVDRVQTLAKELAEGAIYEQWSTYIRHDKKHTFAFHLEQTKSHLHALLRERGYSDDEMTNSLILELILSREIVFSPPEYVQIFRYIFSRWGLNYPNIHLLAATEFISLSTEGFRINKSAFDLLEETGTTNIFISYKRSESSAFALLIHDRLKQVGLNPFVDMQLQAGADWHSELEQNIKKSDYFIILLGQDTLNSSITIQEIQHAIEDKVTIIPIWHHNFVFEMNNWDIPPEVSQVLETTHTIRVIEENPLTYDTALRELLNRFGITL